MPQASDEDRAKWGGHQGVGEDKAMKHLEGRGYKLLRSWYWRPPPGVTLETMSLDDYEAMKFLVDEWDFGGLEPPAEGIEHYEHHGKSVAVRTDLKGKHRNHCLCFYPCRRFHPGEPTNCSTAQSLFELCKHHGIVTPVYECPDFEPGESGG